MVVLAGSQVWWTWEVEDVFEKVRKGDKMGMKNFANKMHSQIDDLVVKVCNCLFHSKLTQLKQLYLNQVKFQPINCIQFAGLIN